MKRTERRWMWKRALSVLLACAMLFTSVDLTALAAETDVETEMTVSDAGIETVSGEGIETVMPDEEKEAQEVNGDNSVKSAGVEQEMFSFEAKNDIGSLFVDDMQEAVQNEQATMFEEYAVTDIAVSGTTAKVTLHAADNCTVVICIYEEGSQKPYAFGSVAVAETDREAEVIIKTDQMPQYFEMRAYLVETNTLRPLSKEFYSKLYTKTIQQVMNTTVNDFDPEVVVNLDDDDTTNFLAFKEGTVIVRETEETNILTEYDEASNTYSFGNADETIKGLKEGDIFVYYDTKKQVRVIRVQGLSVNDDKQNAVSVYKPTEEQIPDREDTEEQIPSEEDTGEQIPDEEDTEEQIPDEEDTEEQIPDEEDTEEQIPSEEDTEEQAPIEEDTEGQTHDKEGTEEQRPGEESIEVQANDERDSEEQKSNEEGTEGQIPNRKVTNIPKNVGKAEQSENETTDDGGIEEEADHRIDENETGEDVESSLDAQEANIKEQEENVQDLENESREIVQISASEIRNCEYLGEMIEDTADFIDKFVNFHHITQHISNKDIESALLGGGEITFETPTDMDIAVGIIYNGREKKENYDTWKEYDTWNLNFGADVEEATSVALDVSVSYAFEADIESYGFWGAHYVHCSLDMDTIVSGNFSVETKFEIPLTSGKDIDTPYVRVEYRPKFVIGGKVTASVTNMRIRQKTHLHLGHALLMPVLPGIIREAPICDKPEKLKLDVNVYVGVMWEPKLEIGIFDEVEIVLIKIGMKIGIILDFDLSLDSATKDHLCFGECAAFTINFSVPLGMDFIILGRDLKDDIENLLTEWFPNAPSMDDFPEPTKLFELYYCTYHNEIQLGKCPYIGSDVTCIKVEVHDEKGIGINGAKVICALGEGQKTTDDRGRTELEICKGEQNVYVEADGVRYSKDVKILENGKAEVDGVISDDLIIVIKSEAPLAKSTIAEKVFVTSYQQKGICYAAIMKDGSLYMWGDNAYGQLGIGTTYSQDQPVKILDNVKEFQFSPDGLTCAAITNKKELYLWGSNQNGTVGDSEEYDGVYRPLQVLEKEKIEKFIFSPESNNSAAITVDGKLYMWGDNANKQISGVEDILIRTPRCIRSNVAELVMENDTCAAITTTAELYLWGYNVGGVAGKEVKGNTAISPEAVQEAFLENVDQVTIQNGVGAALTQSNVLYMWGIGYSEEILPDEEDSYWVSEKKVDCEGKRIREFTIGTPDSKAVTTDGTLYMWKDNSDISDIKKEPTPINVTKIAEDVKEYYEEGGTSAFISEGNQLFMSGDNSAYQLGNGTLDSSEDWVPVLSGEEVVDFTFLAEGKVCVALVKNGNSTDMYGWGSALGLLSRFGGGFTPTNYTATPELIGIDVGKVIPYSTIYSDNGTFTTISANFGVLTTDGNVKEWFGGVESTEEKVDDIAEIDSAIRNDGTSSNPVYQHYMIGIGNDGEVYTWKSNSSLVDKKNFFGSKDIFENSTSAAMGYSIMDITEEISAQSTDVEEALISTYAEAASQQIADFTNLLPNELYNIYAMKSRETEDCLASDNLLYIGQATSDGDGNLNVTFEMKEAYVTPDIFCVGFSRLDISSSDVAIPDIVYDGNRHIPDVTVTYNGQVLKRGVDYKAYLDAYVEEVGEYELTVKGIGLYCGEKKAVFRVIEGNTPGEDDDPDDPAPDPIYGEVLPEDIPADGIIPEGLWIAGVAEAGYDYTGKAIKPEVRVYDHKKRLAEKTDYTIAYKNNTKAYGYTADDQAFEAKKAPAITVTGKGNYTGKETQTFRILPLDISTGADLPDGTAAEGSAVQSGSNVFAADNMTIAANKKNQKPVPALMWNNKKLKNNTDYTVTYYDSTGARKLDSVKEAGNYYIELTGKGNFTGTRRVNLTVAGQADQWRLMGKMTVAKIPDQPYTGSAVEPALTVKDGKTTLNKDEHYTVSYSLNTEIGTAYAVVTGIESNGYSGTKRVSFRITGGSVSKAAVTGLSGQTFVYGGVNKEPELTVAVKVAGVEKTLQKETDYKVSWQKNRDAGTATAIITGIGGYTGTLKKTFKIQAFDMAANPDGRFTASLTQEEVPYAKGGAKPGVTVTFLRDNGSTQKLKEGKDYTLTYQYHTVLHDGSRTDKIPTVTIKGKGNFKGTYGTKLTYKITQQDLGSLTLTAADKTYQNKKNIYASKVTVTDLNGKVLKAGTDYEKAFTYTYKNQTTLDNGTVREAGAAVDKNDIIPAGTVLEVTVSAKGNYTGTKTGEYRITQASIASASVSIPKQIYTGQAITPDKDQITVRIKGKTVDADQYEIVPGSYKNNVKKGTASMTIRGVDNYGGTKTVKFTIKAKGFLWWWRKG